MGRMAESEPVVFFVKLRELTLTARIPVAARSTKEVDDQTHPALTMMS